MRSTISEAQDREQCGPQDDQDKHDAERDLEALAEEYSFVKEEGGDLDESNGDGAESKHRDLQL